MSTDPREIDLALLHDVRRDAAENDKERLIEFHKTISEQLNARLSESPKFFGLLIVVSTGYGYVLSTEAFSSQKGLVAFASLLSFAAVLWAIWYLAALGYAFRFLQNSQHCIEYALGWSPRYVPLPVRDRRTGQPPDPPRPFSLDAFWLLPGIYHAHAAGLVVLLGVMCSAFTWKMWQFWPHCVLVDFSSGMFALGVLYTYGINMRYLNKFRQRWHDPEKVLTNAEKQVLGLNEKI
ncbi:MAG TPA: hypothetical protein VFP59_03805 [Candidatus Angelobacter sp.]|nr:hypothetical protein [Candidatus Angelobacter sp.]